VVEKTRGGDKNNGHSMGKDEDAWLRGRVEAIVSVAADSLA